MHQNYIPLGKFKISSGRAYVTDPGYKPGTWCQGVLKNVKKGIWNSEILISDEGSLGKRCAVLRAVYSGVYNPDILNYQKCEFEVGVDSGTAGIFDGDFYEIRSEEIGEICNSTYEGINTGICKGGCVSSSGFGDGNYSAYIATNKDGEIISICIEFIERR
jgi:hypothetical protein